MIGQAKRWLGDGFVLLAATVMGEIPASGPGEIPVLGVSVQDMVQGFTSMVVLATAAIRLAQLVAESRKKKQREEEEK